ncbi:TerC/Alx family metal homeostasis membrane protein [Gephyromycinifex aptenodytis]|uniref:TerC/Alx family metal homeostasis membrane protein n=1 Tax=Gephyromycinifex aptenodytis TaxID=2716227 RepID=UPI0014487B45|nr:TerC/Alx family metal homeostasis membrane protein [Gephyromycinifex aptenodytis]
MNVPLWVWIATLTVTVAFLLVDVVFIARRPHRPSMGECARHLAFFISAAVLFGVGVGVFSGWNYGKEFYAGWLTEYSLSIDNLFVFIIIMAKFRVPERFQQTALMVGIIIALILRGIFIGVGAALINQFAWVFYIFGVFLIYTAIELAKEGMGQGEDEDFKENAFLAFVERRFPATQSWDHGTKLIGLENGKKLMTPMLIVILALGSTDLMFALDSIPAIFGLTREPFLVLTANIFALMGLRQLYFLIGGLLKRLVYLSLGLSVLLGFIGVKLILHALHENTLPFLNGGQGLHVPVIGIEASLIAIVAILGVTTIASLIKSRSVQRAELD